MKLLTDLGHRLSEVTRYSKNATKVRKSHVKRQSISDCGVYAEFFSDPNTVDSRYDEVAEDLRTRTENGEPNGPGTIYTTSQLAEVLDCFTRFPVLTHKQLIALTWTS